MSAVVLVLQTAYFAVTNADGSFEIPHVPAGHYRLEVWHELASSPELASLAQDISIFAGKKTAVFMSLHSSDAIIQHANKYGEPYSREATTY
jgi:hypothetical protein